MTAPVYANALVTAGIGDASVLVAAPQANPVTGETALVGVLKAFPQCQGGKQPEPGRVALAYEQIAQTVAVAGDGGDLNNASADLLKAAQPVISRQAGDDAAVGTALDGALASEDIAVDPTKRGELIAFLNKLKASTTAPTPRATASSSSPRTKPESHRPARARPELHPAGLRPAVRVRAAQRPVVGSMARFAAPARPRPSGWVIASARSSRVRGWWSRAMVGRRR